MSVTIWCAALAFFLFYVQLCLGLPIQQRRESEKQTKDGRQEANLFKKNRIANALVTEDARKKSILNFSVRNPPTHLRHSCSVGKLLDVVFANSTANPLEWVCCTPIPHLFTMPSNMVESQSGPDNTLTLRTETVASVEKESLRPKQTQTGNARRLPKHRYRSRIMRILVDLPSNVSVTPLVSIPLSKRLSMNLLNSAKKRGFSQLSLHKSALQLIR